MNGLSRETPITLAVLAPPLSFYGQADSANLRHIYYHSMKLTEARTDSIGYYARYISHSYDTDHWPEAKVMSLRLYGYYYENKANYTQAINFYLQALEAARRSGYIEHQTKILADLAAVYTQDMKATRESQRDLPGMYPTEPEARRRAFTSQLLHQSRRDL